MAAVAAGTLGATALVGLVLASETALAEALAGFGANLEVLPDPGLESFPENDLEALDTIFWRNNLTAVTPRLEVTARLATADGEERVVEVLGSRFAGRRGTWSVGLPHTRPHLPVDGRWPDDEAAEAAVGARVAGALGLSPGDEIRLRTSAPAVTLAVVGIVGGGGPEEDTVLVPLSLAQSLAGLPGRISGAEIQALTVPETDSHRRDPSNMTSAEYDAWFCTAYPSAVAFQVDQALPNAEAEVVRRIAGAQAGLVLPLRSTLLGLAGLVLLCATIAATASLAATFRQRAPEVALFVALGSSRGWVTRFHIAEAILLGALGGLAGGLGGLALARVAGTFLLDAPIPWSAVLLPFSILAGAAVATLAVARPLSVVLSASPAAVLEESRP